MDSSTGASQDDYPRTSGSGWNRDSTAESVGSFKGLLEQEGIRDDEQGSRSTGWRSLFAFTTRSQTAILLFAALAGIASGLVHPITTIFLGRVFQAFTDYGSNAIEAVDLKTKVRMNSLILAGLGTADWFLSALFLFLWVLFGELQAHAARTLLFDGLLDKSAELYDLQPSGVAAMTPRLQTHIKDLQLATSQPFGYMLSALASAITSFIIALKFEWRLTLILLSTMPINALILSFISSRMRNNIQDQVKQLEIAAKSATNTFAAIETVKCFNGQGSEFNKFTSPIKKAAVHYLRQVRGNALEIGYVKCMTLLTYMFGFWYGGHLVVSGERTTADIITTFFSCLEITSSIQSILPQMLVLEKGRVSGAVLQEYVNSVPRQSSLGDGHRPWSCKGGISFKNVNFAYPARPEHRVLRDVTCSFPAGKTTFVIGRSGSGKSSLAQLIVKFYEPESGQVILDDLSLRDLDSLWLRSNITLVEQQSVLFEGTIFENIAAGGRDFGAVSIEDVKEAARFALLLETINNLPHGFETRIGAKGLSLSGGQRQRMALARARLRNTPILILDESTSALDKVSRSLVMSAIRQWRQNKTTIFISHDLSLIESDDLVHLFEDGSLIHTGHRSTLETNSAFSKYLKRRAGTTTDRAKFGGESRGSFSPASVCGSFRKTSSEYEATANPNRSSIILANPALYGKYPDIFRGHTLPIGVSHPSPSLFRPRLKSVDNAPSSIPNSSPRKTVFIEPELGHLREYPASNEPSIEHIELEILDNAGKSAVEGRVNAPRERRYLEKSERCEKSWTPYERPSLRAILGTVWPTLSKRRRQILIFALICAIMHAAAIPLFSWVFSSLIATFYMEREASEEALKWSLSMLGLSLVDGAACFGMHILFEYSAHAWIDEIRIVAMSRILDQPRDFFSDEKNSASQLAYCLDRNAEEMRNILGRFFAFALVAVVIMTAAVIWCLVVCWKLTLVGLAITPLSWTLTRTYQVVCERLEGKSNDAGEGAAAILNEAFTNIKTVRGLTLETLFRKKHSEAVEKAFRVGLKRAIYSGVFYGLSQAIMVFNNSVIFFYGAVLASGGMYSVEDILLVFSQLLFALGNVTAIVAIIPQVASSKDTAMRLLNLANLQRDSHEHSGNIRPSAIGDIVFTDLSFSYSNRPKEAVLRNINLAFRQGTTTALVGPSGSGKSTIASLLLRMYPLTRSIGRAPMVSIDGRDILRLSTGTLRELISVVPQTPVLFPATVRENISYGMPAFFPSASMESIRAAATSAGIDDFLRSLPSGYETLIGDGGIEISGGQAQRVAIARALIRNPTVLILDEVTSALDIANAALIRETIRKLTREKPSMTVIIITHSENMMVLADRIVVLDCGRVVEEGSFDELVQRQGEFAKLLSGGSWTSTSTDSSL